MALFIEEDAIKVMKSSLSTSTRSNYISSLIRFIVWIFDNISASLLTPHFFTKLQAADVQDNATGKPNKIRKHIRKAAKQQLNKMNEDPSTHPIILKNLTFQIITTYFFTFKRRYTKKIVRGEELVQACTAPQHNPGEVITIRHGGSSFDRLSSALTYLFNECHVPKDVNEQVKKMWGLMPKYKKGSYRIGAEEKEKLGIRATGKDPLPFDAYVFLAEILCKDENPEYIAAHLFLLLDWNLISRADMIVNANIELVRAWSDCLMFEIGRSKTDQEGKKHVDHPFHVYSCPENPAICPVVAFAKHLIHQPNILKGKCKLFGGTSQYDHYCSILRRIVQNPVYRQSFIDRGMIPEYFGTHSMRKGKSV